jgi:hypothetical protein
VPKKGVFAQPVSIHRETPVGGNTAKPDRKKYSEKSDNSIILIRIFADNLQINN